MCLKILSTVRITQAEKRGNHLTRGDAAKELVAHPHEATGERSLVSSGFEVRLSKESWQGRQKQVEFTFCLPHSRAVTNATDGFQRGGQ